MINVVKGVLFIKITDSHYEEFRNVYDERFLKRYAFWRPVTDEVVEKYKQCGDPYFGFARIHCKECGAEYLRAFSCKCRGFCWVRSVPKMLRLLFLHHRKLLPILCRYTWDSLTVFVHEALDRKDVSPGGILVLQTFGE